jgi:hypothetical protein
VFGGEIAIAGVVMAIAIAFADATLVTPSPMTAAFAVWMYLVALLLPTGRPFWHVTALVTSVIVSLLGVLAIVLDRISLAAGFGAVYFFGAAIYLALTVRRKQSVHGINALEQIARPATSVS